MAKPKLPRGMVLGYTPFLLLSCLASLTIAFSCESKQYFNTDLQICSKCTSCPETTYVMRPCEFHHDTICQPLREINYKLNDGNPHRHKHDQNHKRHRSKTTNHEISWRYGDDVLNKTASTSVEEPPLPAEVFSSEAPFNSAETLVWDWQAIALTSAVLACILFFLVMALYSLHQARQWRRLKENFEADVEELSARLSLMASTPSEKGDFLEAGIGPITDPNYLNNRCVYLEQLLSVRKDEKIGTKPNGNVYIEETNGKT